MISAKYIEELAHNAGFDLCGVARVRPLEEQKGRFARWLQSGFDSRMGYISRNADKRFDPSRLVEGAKTVIVCALNYKNAATMRQFKPGEPLIASYALAKDYHQTIKTMLGQMMDGLRKASPDIRGRAFCDTAPILEKAWAVEAGLGWQGKNGLLINPKLGSFLFLGELVVDQEADRYSEPFTDDRCGTCRLCMDACPNGAIVEPRVIDANRCISRLTIERMDDAPGEYGLHGWIFGCDICQRVCPWNQRTPLGANPQIKPVIPFDNLTEKFWRTITREQFDEIFADTPLSRRGYDQIIEKI